MFTVLFCSVITAVSMAHVGRDGLMEKLKELNIETLSVEHPEVRTLHFVITAYKICCIFSIHNL